MKKFLKKFNSYAPTELDYNGLIYSFLEDSKKTFRSGHYEASVLYSSQAVEIALLIEIVKKYEEENTLDDFKKSRWNDKEKRYTPPNFWKLKEILKEEQKSRPNWILNSKYLENLNILRQLRNAYIHYVNVYLSSISGFETADERMDLLTEKFIEKSGIRISEEKMSSIRVLRNKLLSNRKKNLQKKVDSIKHLEWLENKRTSKFLRERHDAQILTSVFNLKNNPKQNDALDSMTLSFEILENLGYVKAI